MLGILSRSRSLRGGPGHAGDARPHDPTPPVDASEPGYVSGPTLENSTVFGLVENGPNPAALPETKNRYLYRPLPQPPAKDGSGPKMPSRPTTSTGPTGRRVADKRMSRDDMFLNNTSRRPDFDKRVSRDDMFLDSRMSRASRGAFHMPNRGLPTPDASPRYFVPPVASMPPTRLATPESHASGEIQIGMAVSSPDHQDAGAGLAPWPQKPAHLATTQISMLNSSQTKPIDGGLQRPKPGRRRLFGLFGGSKKQQEPGLAILPPPAASITPPPETELEVAPTRSHTIAERRAALKQQIPRTFTAPASPIPTKEPKKGRNPFLRSKASEAGLRQHREEKVPPITFLDVEIPDVRMERYSVMFSGLLGPQNSSSLLARRQATLDKLKTINDRIVQEEEEKKRNGGLQRRVTSPQPMRSPTFSLFPTTPGSTLASKKPEAPPAALPRPSPRFRSNTSPALLPSPVKPSFEHDAIRTDPRQANLLQVNPLQGNPPSQRQPPQQEIPKFDPAQSSLILDSPTEMDYAPEFPLPPPSLRPNIPEPQWQMISPSASTAPSNRDSSSASSSRKRSPSSASSVMTHVTKPSIDEADTVLKSAVEISIARQISISRQQKQLLRPMQSKIPQARKSPTPSVASPAVTPGTATTVGVPMTALRPTPVVRKLDQRNEKLQQTKTAMPTLIRAERAMATQHRKSERAILEAA
jgi:hypothetical protein